MADLPATKEQKEIMNLEHDTALGAKKVTLVGGMSQSSDMEGLGVVAVGTTAVALTFTGTPESIIITNHPDNTGLLFIGKSNVTNLGANAITVLEPGSSWVGKYDDTTNAIYVVSDTAAQSVVAGALL